MGLIDLVVENCEISCMGNAKECPYTDFKTEYREWKIWLDCPNGGILAFEIISENHNLWLGLPTFPGCLRSFDYHDSDGIIAYAKENIDKVENYLSSLTGQLQLF